MLEQLAEWYLRRCGRVVLPRTFIGLALGRCVAQRTGGDQVWDHWDVVAPRSGLVVSLNQSVVDKTEPAPWGAGQLH